MKVNRANEEIEIPETQYGGVMKSKRWHEEEIATIGHKKMSKEELPSKKRSSLLSFEEVMSKLPNRLTMATGTSGFSSKLIPHQNFL